MDDSPLAVERARPGRCNQRTGCELVDFTGAAQGCLNVAAPGPGALRCGGSVRRHSFFPLPEVRREQITLGVMANSSFDLKARARRAMVQAGFDPDFPPEVSGRKPRRRRDTPALCLSRTRTVRDLRALLWSSIDNKESLDLDQIEYAEQLPDGTLRLLVGIADVDGLVAKGSATDVHAAANATSVYAGIAVFPMLPLELSTGLTSLLGDCDRLTMVIEMHLKDSGEVVCHDVFRAWTRNRAKLAYGSLGAWLAGQGPIPPAIAAVPGMDAQIRLQRETSRTTCARLRKRQGALTFGSIEATTGDRERAGEGPGGCAA